MKARGHNVLQRCQSGASACSGSKPRRAAPWRAEPWRAELWRATPWRAAALLATGLLTAALLFPGAASASTASITAPNASDSATPQPASRVITLAPHVTELVYAAGGGDKIVATVNSSNYPPQALDLPRVGDGLSINAEQLLNLQPDLIVGWQNTMAIQKLTPLLDKLGIPVVFSEPRHLDDIPANIEQLGHVLGTQDTASATAGKLRRQLSTLRSTYAQRTPVRVFIEVGTGPLYTLGNDTLTNDAITACGGINVFRDSALVAPAVTIESVLARTPEVVIVANAKADRVTQRADYWKALNLSAAHRGHVYGIDPDALVRPGPRLIQATQELCEKLDGARS